MQPIPRPLQQESDEIDVGRNWRLEVIVRNAASLTADNSLWFVNSLVLWGLCGPAGRVDQALRGVKLKREECGSRRLLHSYSDESYHREESAPGGRSLLRGHAHS